VNRPRLLSLRVPRRLEELFHEEGKRECPKCGSAYIKQIPDLFLAKTARIS